MTEEPTEKYILTAWDIIGLILSLITGIIIFFFLADYLETYHEQLHPIPGLCFNLFYKWLTELNH